MRKLLALTLVIVTILLTACGSSAANVTTGSTSNEIPMATQLVVGSLRLDDTDFAITAEQATELLPMWQVYAELLGSDTAAQEQIDALAEQIQETMTPEQMQAITDMQLTQQDIFTAVQGANTFTSTSQNSNTVTVPSGGGGGGMPAGGPPDGGGGTPPDMGGGDLGGAGNTSDMSAGKAQDAETGSGQARSANVPTPLIQMLIESLQQKIAV